MIEPASHQRFDRILYVLLVALVAIVGIALSSNIGALDQGDFLRAVKTFVDGPADGSVYRASASVLEWHQRDHPDNPLSARNTAALYFRCVAVLQSLFRPTFGIPLLAAISKALVVAFVALAAYRYAERARFGPLARALLFIALATCFFMSHTVYLLASFYQEHVFVVALPLLLYGVLGPSTHRRIVVAVALTLCGGAKTQFFYLPLLFLATAWLAASVRRIPFDRAWLVPIVVAQVICLVPLAKTGDRQYNYYHSTWFGSYVLMSPDELTALGVPLADRDCVGTDLWGNHLVGPWADRIEPGHKVCFEKDGQSIRDVLEPYVRHPALFAAMWSLVSHSHLSARPFHVDRNIPYVVPTTAAGFGSGEYLVRLSALRDDLVTHHLVLIGVLAIVLATLLLVLTGAAEIFVAVVFTALFMFSQIPATLLGEGIRDLGKHLAMAQLSLDLLVVLLVADIARLARRRTRR